MYLANQINEILESKKHRLFGRPTYFYICHVLNRSFKKVEPYIFRYETYADFKSNEFSVSGLYDMNTDKKYVNFNFSSKHKSLPISEKNWKDFKFAISQVCQHEKIHQCQWELKGDAFEDYESSPLEFRSCQSSIEEEQEYLADCDEIDAYGHDIAMEIKFYYPKKDPYEVLRNINRHKKIWSYGYYKKTFKGEDWSEIRNRLHKKVYRWMPYVTV